MGGQEIKKLNKELTKNFGIALEAKAFLKCSKSEIGNVYSINEPLFVKTRDDIFPTVYLLASQKSCLPRILTNEFVIERMCNGADLMVPGIWKADKFDKGSIVQICLYSDLSVHAVGRALMCSDEVEKAQEGKAIQNIHFRGDGLFNLGSRLVPLMEQGTVEIAEILESVVEITPTEQDERLKVCLLASLKDLHTPVLANILYSKMQSYMEVDVKKSTYRKMTKFLNAMAQKGFIEVTETKGDVTVIVFHKDHPEIRSLGISIPAARAVNTDGLKDTVAVKEVYSIPKGQQGEAIRTLILSKEGSIQKEHYTVEELRIILADYYTRNSLIQTLPKFIKIDTRLCDAILTKQEFQSVGELLRMVILEKLVAKLVPFYKLNGKIMKGKPEHIQLVVKKRMGNKKVTLIYGLERFGICAQEFGQELKVKCAASIALTDEHLLVQGSKVVEICQLLEAFGIPKIPLSAKGQVTPNKYVASKI